MTVSIRGYKRDFKLMCILCTNTIHMKAEEPITSNPTANIVVANLWLCSLCNRGEFTLLYRSSIVAIIWYEHSSECPKYTLPSLLLHRSLWLDNGLEWAWNQTVEDVNMRLEEGGKQQMKIENRNETTYEVLDTLLGLEGMLSGTSSAMEWMVEE